MPLSENMSQAIAADAKALRQSVVGPIQGTIRKRVPPGASEGKRVTGGLLEAVVRGSEGFRRF